MTAQQVKEEIFVLPGLRFIPRCRPAWYLGYISWLLLLQVLAPLSLPYAWALELVYVAVGLAVTAGRLTDAGISRRWAAVALPALAAPWIFPRLMEGAGPMGVVVQAIGAVADRNGGQLALASGLLMALVVVGLAPSQVGRASRPV